MLEILDAAWFVVQLCAVVFGSLFLVLLFAEIAERWKERGE